MIIAGVFCGVLLANNLCVLMFMVWGRRIRGYFVGTWVGRLHARTKGVEGEGH